MDSVEKLHPAGRLSDNAPSTVAIKAVNLRQYFSVRGRTQEVFESISFEVRTGEFLAVIGPSGCGKSTLLQVVAGLQPATDGEVWFKGRRVSGPPGGMIYVFQQYSKSVFPWRTVAQNMAFGLEQRHMSRHDIATRTKTLLALVGLDGHEQYFPQQLSGGMQQRLALARALVCEPEVLLMDEPFSAVDAMTRLQLHKLLLDLWARFHTTVIFVTHDVEEAIILSQRVLCLGETPTRIVADVPVDIDYPRHPVETREHPEFLKCRHFLFSKVFYDVQPMEGRRGGGVS